MPMDRSKYPDNWDEIADAVKDRADWKCQECGAPHNIMIVRSSDGKWRRYDAADEAAQVKGIRVIITVHHIGVDKDDGTPGDPGDKMDCRDDNLIALCQRCHLLADMDHHIANRRRNQRERQVKAGQMRLL